MTEVSPKRQLTHEDYRAIVINTLKFTVPAIALFFGQLAGGVETKKAFGIALLALYGLIADILKKWSSETSYSLD
ncbi:MAG TPA: hypothetical protein ENH82_18050 [bacterium]|nr:hypothetical protein [bacterium]